MCTMKIIIHWRYCPGDSDYFLCTSCSALSLHAAGPFYDSRVWALTEAGVSHAEELRINEQKSTAQSILSRVLLKKNKLAHDLTSL